MPKKEGKLIWIAYTLLILIGIGILVNTNESEASVKEEILSPQSINRCSIKIEEKIVRGTSLFPLIKPGQEIKLLYGYYDCHPVERGDVVAYDYAGRENPIIKIIKAIPEDKFHLEKASNGWHIFVNDKILRNSENKPYLLSENGYKMLSLYWKDYNGIIPENTYLILGNLVSGSLDSSRFGLVYKTDILGKVELK